MAAIAPELLMWVTFALIAGALTLYASERVSMETTSVAIVCALMVVFQFAPVAGPDGANKLGAQQLLAGFANPALLTVIALLVMGSGLVQTGLLDRVARTMFARGGGITRLLPLALIFVLIVSAFLNNIPVVVIFIPIMQALAGRLGRSASRMMMPLSFVAILGGMTTLMGSSTNLLVSGGMETAGLAPFGFFGFTTPGLVMAGVGLVYILFVAPRLLPERASLASTLLESGGKQFIDQVTVSPKSKLVGAEATGGFFPALRDVTVRLVQRGDRAVVPPFEDFALMAGDVLVIAATRKALTETLREFPSLVSEDAAMPRAADGPRRAEGQVLAEIMVAPVSRIIGLNSEQVGFHSRHRVVVLGIQRRSRMIRARLTEIRLEAGDVLLIQGARPDVEALRGNPDLLLMEWSATDVPSPYHARFAVVIFCAMIAASASGAVPIVIAAITGAVAMIASGCLDLRQATRAVDRNIVLMIGAALAMGLALQETGGAEFLADRLVGALRGGGPTIVLSAFFLLVALLANVIGTKASAVLFTPIAIGIARQLGVDPTPFAVAVVFGANCSFASPIGYQTNLLVMGPGNYRFADFARAGFPLILVLWIAFTLFVPWYYGLN